VYPWVGGDEIRKHIVLYFNTKIKEKCQEFKYVFFDVFDKYTDENGFLNRVLSDGCVHIRDGKYLTEFIEKNDI
jgi:hypothetical protein